MLCYFCTPNLSHFSFVLLLCLCCVCVLVLILSIGCTLYIVKNVFRDMSRRVYALAGQRTFAIYFNFDVTRISMNIVQANFDFSYILYVRVYLVFRCESTFTDLENSPRLSIQLKVYIVYYFLLFFLLHIFRPPLALTFYFRLNHNANYYFWNRTYRIPKCIASVLTFKKKREKERAKEKKTIFPNTYFAYGGNIFHT